MGAWAFLLPAGNPLADTAPLTLLGGASSHLARAAGRQACSARGLLLPPRGKALPRPLGPSAGCEGPLPLWLRVDKPGGRAGLGGGTFRPGSSGLAVLPVPRAPGPPP